MTESRLLSGTEAAEILGVSLSTVTRMARTGKLPAELKMPGRTGAFLFSRTVVELLARSKEETKGAA